jgi:hypothetical protein
MTNGDTPTPASAAITALTAKTSDDPGGDLITSGTTAATKFAAVGGTLFVAAAASLVSFLGNFKDHPTLGVAASVMVAGGSLSLAWIVVSDLAARSRVTTARLDSLTRLATLPPSVPVPTVDAAAEVTPTGAVAVGSFDVRAGDQTYHLVAVGWSGGTEPSVASSKLLYLVGRDADDGGLVWKSQSEIDHVVRV